jgi:hypothetical protein
MLGKPKRRPKLGATLGFAFYLLGLQGFNASFLGRDIRDNE